jgi:RNA polymerase sigma factor (sigma-70 family)
MLKGEMLEQEINKAYDYIDRYAKFFQLDEDDRQEIVIKFHKYYSIDGGTSVDTYTNMLIKQHRADKFYKQGQKRSGSTTSISAYESTDWIKNLSTPECTTLEEKEAEEALKCQIKYYLDILSEKQRYVVEEYYLNEKSLREIAKDIGSTHQAVFAIKKYALGKIKKYINK